MPDRFDDNHNHSDDNINSGRRRTTRSTRGGNSDDPPVNGGQSRNHGSDNGPPESPIKRTNGGIEGGKPSGQSGSAGQSGKKPSSDGLNEIAGAAGRAAGAKQAKQNNNNQNAGSGGRSKGRPSNQESSPKDKQGAKKQSDSKANAGDQKNLNAKAGAGAGAGAHGANEPSADAAAKPEEGVTGGLKGLGADATGVDYSDKGLRYRLEHQAADAAMDATPYLAQANSARKALKKYNKEKNDAGGNDDQLSDKVEDVADKAVDGGIKATKVAGVGLGTGTLGMGGMMALAFAKTLMFVKSMGVMAMGLLSSIGSAIASAFTTVTSFLAATLSIGTTMAASLLSTMIAGVMIVSTIAGAALFSGPDDAGSAANACSPTNTAVATGVIDRIESDGQGDAQREESTRKLWSVYSELGGTKANTAAVLGNLDHESMGLDPTAVETVYDEPFTIGPEKKRAESVNFKIKQFNPSYAADWPAIDDMGIGLTQWTNNRNKLLIGFADKIGKPWYEFDTQMMFMLEGDEDFRQDQLHDFIGQSSSNVDSQTQVFMSTWVGLPGGHSSLGARQGHARDYALMLERMTADKDYAKGILAGVNIDKSEGNNAAGAFHQDDGCGDVVKSHYANVSADGTGAVPTDLTLTPWKRNDLPESLKKYAVNPEDTGIAWGHSEGWAQFILPDQCVALSDSYMINLYPEWNKGGRSTQKPGGNGHVTATNWAAHFGETTSPVPQKGAVFSSNVFPPYGHTGIVQHVFENGDILVVEQNIRGYSGELAPGLNYSWSWQVIRKSTYESENWDFFKPSEFEPQWYKDGRQTDSDSEAA